MEEKKEEVQKSEERKTRHPSFLKNLDWGKLANNPRTRLRASSSGIFQTEEAKVTLALGAGHVLASLGVGDEKVAEWAGSDGIHRRQRSQVAVQEILPIRKQG